MMIIVYALTAQLIIHIIIDHVLLETTYLSIFFILPVAVSGTISHINFLYWKSSSNLYFISFANNKDYIQVK